MVASIGEMVGIRVLTVVMTVGMLVRIAMLGQRVAESAPTRSAAAWISQSHAADTAGQPTAAYTDIETAKAHTWSGAAPPPAMGTDLAGAPVGPSSDALPSLAAPELAQDLHRFLATAAPAVRSLPDFGWLELKPDGAAFGTLHGSHLNRSFSVSLSHARKGARASDADDADALPLDSLAKALHSNERGACFVALGAWSSISRYSMNIYHQSEYVLPMVEHAIMRARAPEIVVWPWVLLPWSRQLLSTLLPETSIVTAPDALELGTSVDTLRASERCATEVVPFKAVGSSGGKRGYWRRESAPLLARRLVLRACGLHLHHRAGGRPLAVVLERGGLPHPAGAENGTRASTLAADSAAPGAAAKPLRGGSASNFASRKREFADRQMLDALLKASLPGWDVRWRSSAGANTHLCEQLRVWQGARLVITPHGAQINNALFAHPRTVLVEVMPWAKRQYGGHTALLKYSDIVHTRVYSRRPPASEGQWGNGGYSEATCEARETCARFFRDHTNLHVDPRELHTVLQEALEADEGAGSVLPWAAVAAALRLETDGAAGNETQPAATVPWTSKFAPTMFARNSVA